MAPSLPKKKCISSKKQTKSSVDKINILKETPNAMKNISTRSHSIGESSRNQAEFSRACDALSSAELINSTYETDHSEIHVFTADIFDKEAEKMKDSDDNLKISKIFNDKKIKSSRKQVMLETRKRRCKKITVPTCVKSPDVSKNCPVGVESTVKKIPPLETSVKHCKNSLKSTTKHTASKNAASGNIKMNQDCNLKNFLSAGVKKNEASFITKNDAKQRKISQKCRCQVCNFPKNGKNQHLDCKKCNSSYEKSADPLSKQLLKKASHVSKSKRKISSLSKASVCEKSNKLKNNSIKICKKLNKSVSSPKSRKKLNRQESSNLSTNESVGVQSVKKIKYDKIPSKTKTVHKQHAFDVDSNIHNKGDCFKINSKGQTSTSPEISKSQKTASGFHHLSKKKVCKAKILSFKKYSSNNVKEKIAKVSLKIKSSKIAKANQLQAKKKCPTKVNPKITKKCSTKVDIVKKSRNKAIIEIPKCPSKVKDANKNILKAKDKVTKQHLKKRSYKLLHDVASEVDNSSEAFMNQYATVTKKRKRDSVEDECEENSAKKNMNKELYIKAKQQTFSKQVKKKPSEENHSDAVLNKLSNLQTLDCMKNPTVKFVENSSIESSVCNFETSLESKDNSLELATWNNFEGCSNAMSAPKEVEEMLGVSNEKITTRTCFVCCITLSSTYFGYLSHVNCHFNHKSDKKHDSAILKPLVESIVSSFLARNSQIKPLSASLTKSSSLLPCNILKKQLIVSSYLQKLLKLVLSKNYFYFQDFKFKFDEKEFIFNKRFSHPSIIQEYSVYALEEKEKLKKPAAQKPSSETCSSQNEDEQEVDGITDGNKLLQDADDCNRLSVSQPEEINIEVNNCNPTNSANKEQQIDVKCNVEDKIYSSEILLETDSEHNSVSISGHKKICTETESHNSADSVSKEVQICSKSNTVINEYNSSKEEIPSVSSFDPKQIDIFSLYEGISNSEYIMKASSSNSDNNHNVLSSEQKSHISLPAKSTTETIANVKAITSDTRNLAGINEEYCNVKETVPTISCLISEKSETDIVPYSFELNKEKVLLETNHAPCIENAKTTSTAASSTSTAISSAASSTSTATSSAASSTSTATSSAASNTELEVTKLPATAKNNLESSEVSPPLVEKQDLKKFLRFPVRARDVGLSPRSSLWGQVPNINIGHLISHDLIFEAEQDMEAVEIFVFADRKRIVRGMCCAICYMTVHPNQVANHLYEEHSIPTDNRIRTCFLPES